MLFDLRGARRRRFIKVIYAGLAILLGGGLVLFGVGSDQSGNPIQELLGTDNTSDSDISKESRKEVETLERRALAAPKVPARWAALTDAQFVLANQEGYEGQAQTALGLAEVYSDEGRTLLRAADRSWRRYLSLKPEEPDGELAQKMTQAYDIGGLADYPQAVIAQEIVIDAAEAEKESNQRRAGQYGNLAKFAYLAKQDTKGDLAARRAVALAPPDDRKQFKEQLDDQKSAIQAALAQEEQAKQGQPSG